MFREQMESVGDRQEIAFFDLETTFESRVLVEFGAILVCPRKLEELDWYSTFVRPANLSSVPVASVRRNGITRDKVAFAPTFRQIADKVYDILHGRVWAGHNIVEFDCVRIREAFAEIGRQAPESKGTIDSLTLLKQRFGPRAGNMKESSLPDIFTENSWVSPNATTRSRSNGKTRPEGTSIKMRTSPNLNSVCNEVSSPTYARTGAEVANLDESDISQPSAFNMGTLIDQMKVETRQQESSMEERPVPESTETYSAEAEGCSGYAGFLEPDEVSIPSITTSLAPSFRGSQRIQILHKNVCLQLCCMNLRVRFGVSAKFLDHAGWPRLSIVVDTSPSLCRVLDACDGLAQKLSLDSGSTSDWRPVVIRKNGFLNNSTIRLHIPIVANGDIANYATEMYQREASGNTQRLVFSRLDATELDTLFVPGSLIDAYFSLDSYDYQQNAGIRLVAKRFIIQSK